MRACWLQILLLVAIGLAGARASWADEAEDLGVWLDQAPQDGMVVDEWGAEYPTPAAEGESTILWPDEGQLIGAYSTDPIAYDQGQTPPYCRGCARPGCGPAGCGACGGGGLRPTWFAYTDVVALERSSGRPVNLSGTERTVVINNQQILVRTVEQSTRDLDFGYSVGTRLTVGRFLGTDFVKRVHTLEFSYLGPFDFDSSHQVRAGSTTTVNPFTGNPIITLGDLITFFPNGVGGFNFTNLQRAEYSSDFNNYEAVWRVRRSLGRDSLVALPNNSWEKRCTPGFTPSFLAGFRYITINEAFGFHAQGRHVLYDANGGIDSDVLARGDYRVRTTNNLFGFQIGGDMVQQYCRFNLGARGKIGLFGNRASQTSVITASDLEGATLPSRAFGDAITKFAFVGEFGFTGVWHVRPNMNLRAAYDFLWVTGLALAPLQVTPKTGNQPANLDHSGSTFLTGPSLGAEFFW